MDENDCKKELYDFFKSTLNYKTVKVRVEDFIKNHKHVYYCEAIIFSDGTVAEVRPSHQLTVLREIDPDTDNLFKKIPFREDPLDWGLNEIGAIAVWYEGYILPTKTMPSDAAFNSLYKLVENKLIQNRNMKMKGSL